MQNINSKIELDTKFFEHLFFSTPHGNNSFPNTFNSPNLLNGKVDVNINPKSALLNKMLEDSCKFLTYYDMNSDNLLQEIQLLKNICCVEYSNQFEDSVPEIDLAESDLSLILSWLSDKSTDPEYHKQMLAILAIGKIAQFTTLYVKSHKNKEITMMNQSWYSIRNQYCHGLYNFPDEMRFHEQVLFENRIKEFHSNLLFDPFFDAVEILLMLQIQSKEEYFLAIEERRKKHIAAGSKTNPNYEKNKQLARQLYASGLYGVKKSEASVKIAKELKAQIGANVSARAVKDYLMNEPKPKK